MILLCNRSIERSLTKHNAGEFHTTGFTREEIERDRKIIFNDVRQKHGYTNIDTFYMISDDGRYEPFTLVDTTQE
jgi:hypothetical protein